MTRLMAWRGRTPPSSPSPRAPPLVASFGNRNKYEELILEDIDTDKLLTSHAAGSSLSFLEQRSYDFEAIMNRLWAEFFGLFRIILVLVFTLFFQAIRFLTWINKRLFLLPTLIIGTEAWTPTLWVLYEGFYYPGLVLGLALAKSGLTIARVVGDSAAHLVTPVVNIVKAFRLVEVNQVKKAEDIV